MDRRLFVVKAALKKGNFMLEMIRYCKYHAEMSTQEWSQVIDYFHTRSKSGQSLSLFNCSYTMVKAYHVIDQFYRAFNSVQNSIVKFHNVNLNGTLKRRKSFQVFVQSKTAKLSFSFNFLTTRTIDILKAFGCFHLYSI